MIVSRRHKYFFLHCRKTAGSSLSVSLARALGPDDLQLSGLRETAAAGIAFTDRVNSEARAALADLPKGRLRKRLDLAGLRGAERKMLATTKLIRAKYRPALGHHCQHAPAARIKPAFADEWDAFSKFCIVRNPWDKTVSDYYWRIRDAQDPPSFEAFVHAMDEGNPMGGIVPVDVMDNWPLYTIDDAIIADAVIRYEALADDLAKAMADLNIPFDGWLPRAKGSHRPKAAKGNRHTLFDDTTRAIVARLFEKEIETFGYTF